MFNLFAGQHQIKSDDPLGAMAAVEPVPTRHEIPDPPIEYNKPLGKDRRRIHMNPIGL